MQSKQHGGDYGNRQSDIMNVYSSFRKRLECGVYVQAASPTSPETAGGSKRCFAVFQMSADEMKVDLQSM
jgi:hypothetical protein